MLYPITIYYEVTENHSNSKFNSIQFISKPPREQGASRRNMLWREINANLLSKSQSLPAEVRETERTTLNLPKLTNVERVSAIIRETIVSASHLCHVCEDRDWKLDDYETTTLANYEHGRRWYLHLMNKDDYKNNYRSINALAIEQPKQATGLCISQVHCH